jgi:hypothetical protein
VLSEGRPLIEDERFRERVAAIEVELKALEITQMRLIAEIGTARRRQARPEVVDPEDEGLAAAAGAAELLLEVAGCSAMEFDPEFVAGLRARPGETTGR